MSDETLHTAARRVVREFNIVMHEGGLINTHFEIAMDTLDREVRKETERQRLAEATNHPPLELTIVETPRS